MDSLQLVRQWAVLRLLADSGRAFGVKGLAEQFGVSKATIQRDLATLESDFALIKESVGAQKKTYRIDQKIRALETVKFGTMELLALHAALSGMDALAGTPLHEDLRRIADKLRGFLSPKHNGGLDALGKVFVPHARGHVDYSGQADLIDDLADAIARRRVCKVLYHSAWKKTTREHRLRPLRLVWHRSSLYVLGCLGARSEVTTLAVQRIRELEVTGEAFAAPRVDVAAHVRKAFGIFVSDAEEEVEVVFAEEIAWRIEERVFHPDERKERLADGRLRYRVRSSAQWEIVPWVMSFGPLAELAAPAAWREALAGSVEAMGKLYAGAAVN